MFCVVNHLIASAKINAVKASNCSFGPEAVNVLFILPFFHSVGQVCAPAPVTYLDEPSACLTLRYLTLATIPEAQRKSTSLQFKGNPAEV